MIMKYKELSDKATGIVLKKTNVSADNRRGVIKSITIEPLTDSFTFEYFVERLDSNGDVFGDVIFKTKKIKFKDMPEIGTVQYQEDGIEEVEGSYTKVSDENLYVTNWYNSVGKTIMDNAIKHIKFVEGI
jgi:hypothetical protein